MHYPEEILQVANLISRERENKMTNHIIRELENRICELEEQVEEYKEWYGEFFQHLNVMNECGGNIDKAYGLGSEHAEVFTELEVLENVLSLLSGNRKTYK